LAEITVREDVDDEIDGRVEYNKNVADSRVVVMPVATPASFHVDKRPQDVVDKLRQFIRLPRFSRY